jgi:soluble lytic murein transglycosylase-like protein
MRLFLILGISLLFLMAIKSSHKPKVNPQDFEKSTESPLTPLILAVIRVESKGNPKAIRFEPHLMAKHNWPKEWAKSYGLMQIVYGYHKDTCGLTFPAQLFEPKINIRCGIKILQNCITKYNNLERGLGCYNGDKTGRYSKLVLAAMEKY